MFKPYIQNQAFLIPPSFRDFLSDDHEAVILSELIDSLDLSRLYKSYRNTARGTTAYDPGMLFRVLIYAYFHRTFSSRSIALRLHPDIAFMYLSGLQKPDFRTINRFRKEKGDILEQIFVQIVHLAHEMGMISFGTLSLDGTKIYANASKERNETLASLEKSISGFLRDAEAIDSIEDEEFGNDDGRNIPEELKTKEGREKKLRELKEKKERTEKLQKKLKERIESSKAFRKGGEEKAKTILKTKINTTDPEARLMQMKRKDYANGFNVQILTENQIILASHVSSNPADYNELVPTLEKLKNTKHQIPKRLLADTGYFSEENFTFLEREKIDAYIPPQTPEKEETMESLVYSQGEDIYLDTNGNVFEFYQWSEKSDGTRKQGRPRK